MQSQAYCQEPDMAMLWPADHQRLRGSTQQMPCGQLRIKQNQMSLALLQQQMRTRFPSRFCMKADTSEQLLVLVEGHGPNMPMVWAAHHWRLQDRLQMTPEQLKRNCSRLL